MNFDDYRTLYQVGCVVLVLLAASPALSLAIAFPEGGEQFSEFWILNEDNMAEDFPYNIKVGQAANLVLGASNHLGNSGYYLVYAKLRSPFQPLPNVTVSEPSPLSSTHEFQFLIEDGQVWEKPISFEVLDASVKDYTVTVERVSINDQVVDVDYSLVWDSENNEFAFQLFFELYLYNSEKSGFEFHDRFVGLWLNMTA